MPFITIDTNAEAKATKTELSELVELVSAELSKPKDYIAAKINTGKLMSCGANPETVGALIEMKSIGYNGKNRPIGQSSDRFLRAEVRLRSGSRQHSFCRHAGNQCCQRRTHFRLGLCVFVLSALPNRHFCVRE